MNHVKQAPERIPEICISPALKDYLKNENITDGQTDKLVWLYLINHPDKSF